MSKRCPELRNLASELKVLRQSEVKHMAMYLTKMSITVLDQIQENHSTEPGLFVTYAMEEWLNRDVEASWAKVVSALREIEKNTLAAKLEEKYCAPISEPPPASQSGPQVLVSQLAPFVATEEVPVQSSTESSLDHSATPSHDQTTCGPVGDSKLSTAEIQGIKNKAAKLKKKFTSVLIHTKICFTDKEEKSKKFLRDFIITLTSLSLFKQHEDKEFLKEEENRIKTAKDVDEIFEILKPYWNYVDYDFLEHIIKEFGTEELQEEMKEYIAELEEFEKKTTVQDFSLATEKEVVIPAHYRKLAVKLDKDPKMFTLHDVRQFKKSVENESSLKEYSLLFRGVSCSSVEIFLAFPPEAYAKLSEVINASQFRREHRVVSLVFSVSEDTAASLPKRQKSSYHPKGELLLVSYDL